jgi:hypothetical protein
MIVLPPRRRRHIFSILAAWMIVFASSLPLLGQALPAGKGPGSYTSVGITGSFLNINYGQRWVGGGSVYVDGNMYRKIGAEFQFQTLRFHEVSTTRQTTYLAGPRYSFRARGLVPYVKVLAGVGRFTFPYGFGYGNYFVVAPGAGVDFDLNRRLKVRLVDVQYQDWPQFSFGELHPYGVSAGISLRVF